MAIVKNVKPYDQPLTTGGDETTFGQGLTETVGVLAVLDLWEDGSEFRTAALLEADYSGIVAEFQAGSETTILEGAVDSWLAAYSETDPLSTTQRSWIGYTQSFPIP